MRLVSKQLSAAIEGNKAAPANFGLVFNKWLDYRDDHGVLKPVVSQDRKPLITLYGQGRKQSAEILKQRHLRQAAYCQTMEQAGWRAFIVHAKLTAPFVSGLGMTHPTETGLVLDHTSGMPYLPASSQKGVLRLVHLLNTLCDEKGNWLSEDELLRQGLVQRKDNVLEWRENAASKTIYGTGGDKNALAGQLTLLDAYPLTPPELGEEILNPHYAHYYQEKSGHDGRKRGPTEDQSPIPVKFLVVKPGAEFVFRLLLRNPFAKAQEGDQSWLGQLVEQSLIRAITEEGMGAKTSLGFGRFKILTSAEPEKITTWQNEENAQKHPWRILTRKIEAAADWGQLKQLLDSPDTQAHMSQKEVVVAVQSKAYAIRKAKPEKWGDDRDKLLAEWLSSAGLTWQIHAQAASTGQTAVGSIDLSPEDQILIETIEKLADWSVWKNSGIKMESLSLPALKKLREKFSSWKIKDGKGDKPATWKKLNQLFRQCQ